MPVKLRLKRQGRKKAAHYAIVAADSRAPRDGKFIEKVGYYNPLTSPAKVHIDEEVALKWLGNGAQPTDTVKSMLRHCGLNLKFALHKQGKSEDQIERIYTSWWNEKKNGNALPFIFVDVHGKPLGHMPDFVETVKETPKSKAVVEEVPVSDEVAEKIAETVDNATTEVAEKAAEVKETAKETVADAKEAVVEKAAEVKEAAEETVADAKEAVTEKAAEVKDAAEEKVAEAKEAVTEKVAEVKEAVEEKAAEVKETAEEAATEAKEAVEEVAEEKTEE